MVRSSPRLTAVRNSIIQHGAAGFMRNVKHVPNESCARCYGNVDGWSTCFPCGKIYGGKGVDQLAFLTYAWHPAQSGTVMRSYKASPPAPTAVQTVSTMLAYGVVAHQACFAVPGHGGFTSWATVPSLPAKAGVHQLQAIASQFLGTLPMVDLKAANPLVGLPRDFVPGNFTVNGPVSDHVLLLDDTWASGGHIESAAAALKAAGASYVSALVVARWLNLDRGNTQSLIANHLTTNYDPDICPITGTYC